MEKIRRLFSLANLQKENAEEDIRKKRVYFLINLIFLLSFSIFLSLGTNFSPMNNNIISHDSGIFSYIA